MLISNNRDVACCQCLHASAKIVSVSVVTSQGLSVSVRAQVLLTWNCATKHAVPWSAVDRWFMPEKGKTLTSVFVEATMGIIPRYKQGWITGDALLVACAVDPELVTSAQQVRCKVNTEGELTRGMSVFFWESSEPPNVRVVGGVNMVLFLKNMDLVMEEYEC